MSLYTPVFPPTDPSTTRTSPASSFTSTPTAKQQRVVSCSSRLSQLHLAIASLPEVLSPPSAPSSPTSQARSAILQTEIERAVREGRNITDFCKLRSTKLGYVSKQPAYTSLEEEDGVVPWILAETEEEWFEWEETMARRRTRQKGKERAHPAPPSAPPMIQSQNAHDKVLSWKARLEPPTSSPLTVPTAPGSTTRSSLGFPVVKRSSMLKESKLKAMKPSPPLDPGPRPIPELQATEVQTSALQVDTRPINAAYVDTADIEHEDSFSAMRRISSNAPSEVKEDISFSEEPENNCLELRDFSVFPPSTFPAGLPTSTPREAVDIIAAIHAPPPSFPPDLPTSTPSPKDQDINDITIVADDSLVVQAEIRAHHQPAHNSPTGEPSVPQPTPPSPPYSTATPPSRQPCASEAEVIVPATPTKKHVRPLTPPPDAIVPVSSAMLSSPRTPERQPLKKHRTVPLANSHALSGSGLPFGPTTPDSAINGAGITRAMTLPFPRTPDRQNFVELLATSRTSLPRPRPPSRKELAQAMDIDYEASEAGVDPSPAKSDRSYFSSPASSSSSGSPQASIHLIPDSPKSPLNFTQNPSRFAPLGESTQVSPRSRLGSMQGSGSQGAMPSRGITSQSQKSLGRTSSGIGLGYNSQFDINGKVDQLSNFMSRDVDFNGWAPDSDDEDDAVVENMTYPASSVEP